MSQAKHLAIGSILVGMLVLALKTAAWWLTGSAALFSDAAESVVNVAASGVAFIALHMAARPADENHPYGHDKAEFFAAVIEGVMIVIAAAAILNHAWATWREPATIETPMIGMALNGVASLGNLAWGRMLLRRGRALRSPALVADGNHLMTDVVTSIGVIGGLAIAIATGSVHADAFLAVMVTLYVLFSGVQVLRESVGGLMDEAPAARIVERIRVVVGEHAEGAIEVHDLRARHAGRLTFLECHLVVPGSMTVADSHSICDRIEAALKAEIEGLVITIHVEPDAKAKHRGVLVL